MSLLTQGEKSLAAGDVRDLILASDQEADLLRSEPGEQLYGSDDASYAKVGSFPLEFVEIPPEDLGQKIDAVACALPDVDAPSRGSRARKRRHLPRPNRRGRTALRSGDPQGVETGATSWELDARAIGARHGPSWPRRRAPAWPWRSSKRRSRMPCSWSARSSAAFAPRPLEGNRSPSSPRAPSGAKVQPRP